MMTATRAMWSEGWRARFQAAAAEPFDVLVIGGGITGAGVVLAAARAGLRVALIEQNDFASGTSSGSSKLVHGGLRYLAAGDWRLTRESVRERQRLMHDLPGLVEPLDFMLPVYHGDRPGRLALTAALGVYDLMAGKRHSHYLPSDTFAGHMPYLRAAGLKGGFVYRDGVTDDVRLTLRVIEQAKTCGALAANYLRAERLLFTSDIVTGAAVYDAVSGARFEIAARCVVNATGPWSDRLRGEVDGQARLRPLRGSHFVFPFHVLPVARAVAVFHPRDQRPLFAIPWQGATVFGTTDVDHDAPMDEPPMMSAAESAYLIEAAQHYFPALDIAAAEALSVYAGVRPVVRGESGATASQESRESALDVEHGLITVTGGKLTTFRVTAHEVLEKIGAALGREFALDTRAPIISSRPQSRPAAPDAAAVSMTRRAGDARIGATDYRVAHLQSALAHEAVEHLDDLLLRRTRLGLLLPAGGEAEFDRLEALCRAALGWDAARWRDECERYRAHWQRVHAPV